MGYSCSHPQSTFQHLPSSTQGKAEAWKQSQQNTVETKGIKSGAINSDAVDLLYAAHRASKTLVSAVTVKVRGSQTRVFLSMV